MPQMPSEPNQNRFDGNWLFLFYQWVKSIISPVSSTFSGTDFLVRTANASLGAERVVTDTSTVVWDWSTAGQAKANVAGRTATQVILGDGTSNPFTSDVDFTYDPSTGSFKVNSTNGTTGSVSVASPGAIGVVGASQSGASGAGATITLRGGDGGASTGAGGNVWLNGGTSYGGTGGGFALYGGTGYNTGGSCEVISGGASNTSGTGGYSLIGTLAGPATSNSGFVYIYTGDGGGTSGTSGDIQIYTGQTWGASNAGDVTITGGSANGSGAGGSVVLTAGTSASGTAGTVDFSVNGGNRLQLTGTALILGGGSTAHELRFLEPSGSGSNYTAFKAQAQGGNVTYTLPAADATAGGFGLTSDGSGGLSWTNQKFVIGTESTTTGGTDITFTGIPSGVKMIVINIVGISPSGNDGVEITIGDSGGLETTGYDGGYGFVDGSAQGFTFSTGAAAWRVSAGYSAASTYTGTVTLTLEDESNNTWLIVGQFATDDTTAFWTFASFSKSLSAVLDRVNIGWTGASTFDSNSGINILYQ